MLVHAKKVIFHPLFSGSAVMFGGSMAVNVVNYIYHLVMGRVLGPIDYGVLASIFSILYITGIVPTSSSFAIVKFISSARTQVERNNFYNAVRKKFLYASLVLGAVILIFSPTISKFLHISGFLEVALVGPTLFFMLIMLVNQAALQGVLKFMGVVLPNLIASLGKLIIGLSLVYLGWSVIGAVGAILVSTVIAYLISIKLVRKEFKHKEASVDLKPFLKFSVPVLLQALAFTSFFTLDVLLVKHFLSAFDAGLYAALSTLGKIIFFASQPITQVMFPIIASRKAKGEKYRKVFFAAFFATFGVSFLIVLIYRVLPDIAIGTLYGSDYLSASPELYWMGLFLAFYTLSYILVNFLLSVGRTKIVALPIIAAMAQVVLIWFLHSTLRQVIQVSLICVLFLFVGLLLYLLVDQLKRNHAKA